MTATKRLIAGLSLVLLAMLCGLPQQACAGFFGPSNFDECILDNMKGVTSDLAARAIYRSCLEKFPKTAEVCTDFALTSDQMNHLKGTAHFSYGSFFVDLYNGNPDVSLTNIQITIKDLVTQESRVYQESPSPIKPLAQYSLNFFASVANTENGQWSWSVLSARGCK